VSTNGRMLPFDARPLVIALGMPKAGTTSIAQFFACNGWRTSHWICDSHEAPATANSLTVGNNMNKCAFCVLNFVQTVASREHPGSRGWREHPDLSGDLRRACGDFDVFAEIDHQLHSTCLYPQVAFLHTLLRALPRACFILNVRPLQHWLESVRTWGIKELKNDSKHAVSYQADRDTLLAKMLSSCPIYPRNESGLLVWHERHLQRTRDAIRGRNCALEVHVEDPLAGHHLAAYFTGTRASCWSNHNQQRSHNFTMSTM
jgi:hypothetical protein